MDRGNCFADLADRAVHGDQAATRQLRRQLQPQLLRMVRHALEHGGTTPLARRILATARHVSPQATDMDDAEEDVVHVVAEALCESIMAQLHPRPAAGDAARETVCIG